MAAINVNGKALEVAEKVVEIDLERVVVLKVTKFEKVV